VAGCACDIGRGRLACPGWLACGCWQNPWSMMSLKACEVHGARIPGRRILSLAFLVNGWPRQGGHCLLGSMAGAMVVAYADPGARPRDQQAGLAADSRGHCKPPGLHICWVRPLAAHCLHILQSRWVILRQHRAGMQPWQYGCGQHRLAASRQRKGAGRVCSCYVRVCSRSIE